MTEQEKSFLIGLEKLSRETGIVIGGCGCCSSPFMIEEKNMPENAGYGLGYMNEICWICPSDRDNWENYRQTIVK